LHIPATGADALANILDRAGPLPVRRAEDGTPLAPGTVMVGRADHHLLVLDSTAALSRGPRENGHRPSVDVLFRSAARALGPRVVAVVLGGARDAGAAGGGAGPARGGRVLAQDPEEALSPGMPMACVHAVSAETLPVTALAARLATVVREPIDETLAPPPT